MTVVPTNDGEEDDGVIWFRCPQCQGFLPKLSGAGQTEADVGQQDDGDRKPEAPVPEKSGAQEMLWDSPAEMMAEEKAEAGQKPAPSPFLPEDDEVAAQEDLSADPESTDEASEKPAEPAEPVEPIAEYASLLANSEVAAATPYRPWGTYEVGQCVHHLAWEDCGVVVGKEELPGGRKIIKCYFKDAGVVRLIEQAPR